jgi:hypothetical protein
MESKSNLPFVTTEKLLFDILVPKDRDAVIIRADKSIEFVHAAKGVPKGSLILLVSESPLRTLLARLFALRLIAPRGLRPLGTYVVMPSTDRPEYIVPWRGKASRIFFRTEATSPYNSRLKYIIKWILASVGISPFLQHAFVIVCGRD